MKKVLAIILALVLVLSLSVTAFAAETTGSITISNATKDETYKLYKIFDATYAVDDDNKVVVDSDGKAVVSYTIDTDNQFFDDMFGADGTQPNDYFNYTASTGVVTKKAGVIDSAVVNYLDSLTDTASPDEVITATDSTVVFEDIPTGYYLIDRGLSSTVTITSNMPDVEVIDKNQHPNVEDSFSKLIYDEKTGTWVKSSTASIGDVINWKIDFVATNYDGDDIVEYYTIRDNKSSALWVEFDDIKVVVDGKELTKGYYHCANSGVATGEWDLLGTGWGDADPATADPNEAQWYLIHYGFDEFEIVIPWLDDYNFNGIISTTKGYNLTFDLKEDDGNNILSNSIYGSPATVEILYKAAVGPDAVNATSKNSAILDWVTPEGTFGPEDPQTTETKVYNLGITKTANDGTSTTPATRLAGATFKLYRNYDPITKTYSDPVWVIPTNNTGVYILDDIDTHISGSNRESSRDKYEDYWKDYIGTPTTNKRNDMVTPDNGQLVILGLDAGTYYLEETIAPEGYNRLETPVEVVVGGNGSTAIYSNDYKDLSGNAVTYTVYNVSIENNRGVELPSTGGEGTMMLIAIGAVVAMAFAILLITHKKMAVYHD